MKKNILVILIVIGVVGVLVYLLKDRLKALLGERAKGEEIPGEIKEGPGPLIYQGPFERYLALKRRVTPGVIIGRTDESPARWLQEEIAPILQPMYPARYIAITKGLFAYLTIGEGEVTRAQEIISKGQEGTHPYPPGDPRYGPTNGPYSWALPQF